MSEALRLPLTTRIAMLLRLLAVQGAWNYETMAGNGIAFAMEPALRLLPGGKGGARYREAMARQSGYFNTHPYLAGLAVGGLARAELEGDAESRIDRFRAASCGPLGSVGDQIVWAAWLPFCSLLALMAYGAGLRPVGVIILFLGVFNAGHLALRAWALDAGWREGLKIAKFLAHPIFRQGPNVIARATAVVAGIAIPLAIARIVGARPTAIAAVVGVGFLWGLATVFIAKRAGGWRAALIAVGAFAIYSVLS
jgi:PTS system mannose-specific IID component